MTLDFTRIRLRNGRTYDFPGVLESANPERRERRDG